MKDQTALTTLHKPFCDYLLKELQIENVRLEMTLPQSQCLALQPPKNLVSSGNGPMRNRRQIFAG